jgi:5'-methylthioadenosine phosphorylase
MPLRLAVIGGREVGELLHQGVVRGERRYAINTPFGQADPIHRVAVGGQTCYLLPRQGDEGPHRSPGAVNYRANIYALKELGAQAVLAWSGPAALVRDLPAGGFVLPDDLIDLTRGRERTFFEKGPRGALRQAPVFCATLTRACEGALARLGLAVTKGGTYVCTEGPRLETAAESRLFAHWGGTLVGMTLCPEVFLARELAMCYAALCYVTGHAEGLGEREFASGSIYRGFTDSGALEAVEDAARRFPAFMKAILQVLSDAPEMDACQHNILTVQEAGGFEDDGRRPRRP